MQMGDMGGEPTREVLGEGRFLRLVRRDGWEFVERTATSRAAFIGAVTDDGRLVLTEEYRVPVGRPVVGCPAGLIGDEEEGESIEDGVRRELIEEAGYDARSITLLGEGPTSPGMSDEVIALALAEGLTRVGAGGGVDGESITLHEVPLREVDAWLDARARAGHLIDPKVFAILGFLRRRSPAAFAPDSRAR